MISIEDLYDAEGCIRDALDTVASSWAISILIALRSGPKRYSQFKACLPDINDRMLSQTLHRFGRNGLVTQQPISGSSRHEYVLTPLGDEVSRALGDLAEVIIRLAPQVAEARERYDSGQVECLE
ncbi:winged helix-turn-helix transcriptional regulator [Nocardioides sp. Bht2]|uniref:winged helix-turn-helix transcriptional regulator n=1 Tax=Nocardioides sp. Bht2 TaxID=3392297 RepID=UPI0039B65F3E